jgi:hypothetical protein
MTEAPIERLESSLRTSSLVTAIFDRWSDILLPDCWLVAGVVAQTVWNLAHRRAAEADVKDVDLVYFDGADQSADAERGNEARIRGLFADLSTVFDVKNQARVHFWHEAKFGYAITPYGSVEAAIASFPTTATAVGVRPRGSGIEVCAPFGLSDLLGMVVRPNKTQITRPIYEAKIARWRPCWPSLKVLEWDASTPVLSVSEGLKPDRPRRPRAFPGTREA